MNRSRPTVRLALLLGALTATALAGLVTGCKSGGVKEDPILRLAADESLVQGKELMAQEKYRRARPYLSHAFEVEPNSVAGREGLLLLADSYFLEGGEANWIQSEAKYRDFLNRFPTSNQAAYAQYQIANSLARRVEKPNRDQTSTRKALEAYEELLRLYPTSEYTAEAQSKIQQVRDTLADSEYAVGEFYLTYRYPAAAITRFEGLLEEYPNYGERDKVLFHLGLAYARSGDPEKHAKAEPTFDKLRQEYPESRWIDDIPRVEPLPPQPKPPADDTAVAEDGSGPQDAPAPDGVSSDGGHSG